jgi:NAD(P)H-nitrite reductase large subunit
VSEKQYVIVGGGIAGTTAAEELRKIDAGASITLIDQEHQRLYSRVLLEHYVTGKIERDRLFLRKEEWYQGKGIDFQSGVVVEEIDTKNKFVKTSEGRELPYDKLLITAGGEVNLIEQDLKGVSYMRTLDDADYLLQMAAAAQTKKDRAAIVRGGGFIAVEYTNFFVVRGFATTILLRGDQFMSRVLLKESSDLLLEACRAAGVTVLFNEKEAELVGDDQLEAIRLADGRELPCDILGVGVGIHTEKVVLEKAGLSLGQGIFTNEFLETNVKDVYAAGDIAEYEDVILGRRLVMGNWVNAFGQARVVAKNMAGERTAYELVSSYSTNLLGLEVAFVGDVSKQYADEVVLYSQTAKGLVQLFEREGRTVGAILLGDMKRRQEITNAIKNKKRFE